MSAFTPARRALAWLQLVRLPNVFTAAADAWAGYLYARSTDSFTPAAGFSPRDLWTVDSPAILSALAIASMCLYAGGVALNDVCDARLDTLERPERPIPSGRITRRRALIVALTLSGIGWAAATTVSGACAVVAAGLLASIVLYDLAAKPTPAGPSVMGFCRALNFVLGAVAVSSRPLALTLAPAGLIWLYVASVTWFARDEAAPPLRPGKTLRARATVGTLGIAVSVLCWPIVAPALGHSVSTVTWAISAVLAVFLLVIGLRASACPDPCAMQAAVGWFIVGLVLFDAVIASTAAGATGLLVALWLIPTLLVRSRLPMS
ncbi:MAG: UbiA family prenyltransferase [Planctomycetota bacterium]